MRKALLITGIVIGTLVVLFGLLGILGSTDPSADATTRSDGLIGSIIILVFGLVVLVPCIIALRRGSQAQPLPAWTGTGVLPPPPDPSGSAVLGAAAYGAPVVVPDARQAYIGWFGWCQRELGGDAMVLHAATMAALTAAASGSQDDAARAARAAVPPGATRVKVSGAKVKALAAIGSGTLAVLEPGERVLVSFRGLNQASAIAWHAALGLIGQLIAASGQNLYLVSVTDRRVVVLSGTQLKGTASALHFAEPRAAVTEARYRGGLLGNGAFILRLVTGARTRIAVNRMWRQEARAASSLLAPGVGQTPLPQVSSSF